MFGFLSAKIHGIAMSTCLTDILQRGENVYKLSRVGVVDNSDVKYFVSKSAKIAGLEKFGQP